MGAYTGDIYPDTICVSGMPLMWRGWNGTYTRDGERNNRPVYKLPAHNYFGVPIRPVKIAYNKYRWLLYIDESPTEYSIVWGWGTTDDLPFGDWNKCLVSPTASLGTFIRSNDVYIYTVLLVLGMSILVY